MSALAYFLESEGLATTGISLIREHTLAMGPPRALWVPFPLGRPLGAVGDAAFQLEVIRAALALLEREAGPVLEDFPEDAPGTGGTDSGPWSCPVSFPAPPAEGLAGAVEREMAGLAPWYELSVARRGRTTLSCRVEDLERALALVQACVEGREGVHEPDGPCLRAAIENLKAYYQEAVTARPGQDVDGEAVARWLWNDTALSRLLRELARAGPRSVNAAVRLISSDTLVPRAHAGPQP